MVLSAKSNKYLKKKYFDYFYTKYAIRKIRFLANT